MINPDEHLTEWLERVSYSNSSTTTIDRGIQLIKQNKVKLVNFDANHEEFQFAVKSQYKSRIYNTYILLSEGDIKVACDCPFNYDGLCKHLYAAFITLIQKIKSGSLNLQLDQTNTQLNFTGDLQESLEHWTERHPSIQKTDHLTKTGINVIKRAGGTTVLEVTDHDNTYTVTFSGEKGKAELHSSCYCKEETPTLCSHKLRALNYLNDQFGPFALQEAFDWQEDKAEILSYYGYSLNDDYAQMIGFDFHGFSLIPQIDRQLVDPSKIDDLQQDITEKLLTGQNHDNTEIPAVVLYLNTRTLFPLLGLSFIKGIPYKRQNKIKKISGNLDLMPEALFFHDLDETYKNLYMWFQSHMNEDLVITNTICPDKETQDYYENYSYRELIDDLFSDLPLLKEVAIKYIPLIKTLFSQIRNKNVYFIDHNVSCYHQFSAKDITPVAIAEEPVKAKLTVKQEQSNYIITVNYFQGSQKVYPNLDVFDFPWVVHINSQNTLACWQNPSSLLLAIITYDQQQSPATIYIPAGNTQQFTNFINYFQNEIEITMDKNTAVNKQKPKDVTFRIVLSEMGKFLLLYPVILYDGKEMIVNDNTNSSFFYTDTNDNLIEVERNPEKEKEFYEFVTGLHPKFSSNNLQDFFYLESGEVMEGLWFLTFFEKCKEQGVEVYGFDKLQNIKYNPHKPSASYTISSGIDWFDVQMNVQFGEQTVSLKEIRKSVLNKQNAVKLDDGSTGILPEDWVNKWLNALKFGKLKDQNTLSLSNLHFLMVDELYKQLDDKQQKKEIEEKKKKLNNFKKIEEVPPPKGLKAELRNYQQEGLNWLNFLYEFGWGGCLADDMGLGKTIQMLALILHTKQKDKRKKHVNLVVAPTTLLFNWQTEINKFCPELHVNTYWGNNRDKQTKNWKQYDIILTTYGTLTNDIELIRNFRFNIAILDESQAIKNPSSLRFKTVRLIKANARFTLTGTPIENNTLELFAQMQFLNPGYLGSLHFFKKEFSNAIDKQKDKEQSKQLSKLIKPFILRRKKEDVAQELPEKTETLLYCEMEKQQRKVYDHFKEQTRQQLLNKIDQEGMEKAKFTILESLLKVRQICDSPALLNTAEDYGDESIKVDELIRHINEKTGKHKIIVFSQFIGMLRLIKDKLAEHQIDYAYIDGQTKDRKKEVEKFQKANSCRIFLLSIKAGGVGLNLTEADYVYIMDPWWNPAVESQAIDRTHRIGQDKHVFAYKMVCKDTIEEKILELQHKKQEIADDIVSTDQGFVSNLSRQDIEELLV